MAETQVNAIEPLVAEVMPFYFNLPNGLVFAFYPDSGSGFCLVDHGCEGHFSEGSHLMAKKSLRIFVRGNVTVLALGDMEIWDGADLALLRESLTRCISVEKKRNIGVDMSHVKYIPSGFFGLLFDWHEQGARIRLFAPQPNVRQMLWFSRFFHPVSDDGFELRPDTVKTPPSFTPATVTNGQWPRVAREVCPAGFERN
jgi:hypothetical protein